MPGSVPSRPATRRARRATAESPAIKALLITLMVGFFALFLILPLVIVFQEAFKAGWSVFWRSFEDRATLNSIKLTLIIAAIVLPLNSIFGIAAAWAITRFHFRGKSFLISLIDLPLWVSPVVGGLIYVLIFGARGWLGPFLQAHHIAIIYALPGMILATLFVTFPFVARGLIPLMQAQGFKEEEAATTLGANAWQIFFRVTLPKIKWGLLYGMILCNARAMGEFGAVSVVSGHIANKTNTMPLQIELLYNGFSAASIVSAFALASVLSVLGLVTLVLKTYAEWRTELQLKEALGKSK